VVSSERRGPKVVLCGEKMIRRLNTYTVKETKRSKNLKKHPEQSNQGGILSIEGGFGLKGKRLHKKKQQWGRKGGGGGGGRAEREGALH